MRLLPVRELMRAGRYEQAASLLQRIEQQNPGQVDLLLMLAAALARAGKGAQATYQVSRARGLVKGRAPELLELGNRLNAMGFNEEAIEVYRDAVAVQPSLAAAYVGLAGCHLRAYRLGDAITACRAGLVHEPRSLMLRGNLAVTLLQSGRAREAVRVLAEARKDEPGNEMLASNLAVTLNYAGGVSGAEVLAAHEAYGAVLEREFAAPPAKRPADPDPERRLRVGIVSADLRAHPCGTFIEPWLAGHSREGFAITCYSVGPEDAATQRLKGHPVAWRSVSQAGVEELAEGIRRDGIDVLMDLSGHTQGHRLAVFQRRPAPVQVTYFGYPNTTGLRVFDGRLVDSITDPVGSEGLATEPLVRLDPCFLCLPPPANAPEVGGLPMDSAERGVVTFGSFNNVAKIDERTIELWAGVLRAVPRSRLLLKYYALSQEYVREDLLKRLVAGGIEAGRVVFDPPGKGTIETLRAYQRVDIGLDTFPYHGTTTTCEALFMGVPVVTRMGDTCAARVSGSILAAAGAPEWAGKTDEEFVSIAKGLAGDAGALARIRAGLRDKVLGSALCDQRAFVGRLEGAIKGLWNEACKRA